MLQRRHRGDGQNLGRDLVGGRQTTGGCLSRLLDFPWFLIVFLVLALAGCTSPEPEPLTFRYQLPATPVTLDPAKSGDSESGGVIDRLFDGLMRLDRESNVPVDELAKSHNVSSNGLVYEFRLVTGARFHNGRSVLASDFKYSWERVLEPEIDSPKAWLFDLIEGVEAYRKGAANSVEGIEAEDPDLLRVRLRKRFAPFLYHLTQPAASAVPREAVDRQGVSFELLPVGSGPYKIVRFEKNIRVELAAFDDHFRYRPQVRRLIYEIVPNGEEALQRYQAGELDLLSRLPTGRLRSLQQTYSADLRMFPGSSWNGFCFRCDEPPFDDPRVRRAFALAIDRDVLVRELGELQYTAAVGFVPQSIPGHDPTTLTHGYDLKKATELLAAAGYPEGKGFPPQTYITYAGELAMQVANFLSAAIRNLGVTVGYQQEDFGWLVEEQTEGHLPFSFLGWTGEYPDPEPYLRPLFHSRGPENSMVYRNPEVDRILEAARIESDPKKRRDLYREAEQLIIEAAPCVALYQRTEAILLRPRWQNIPLGYHRAYLEIERAELAPER